MTAIECDRCGTPRTWRFTECPVCGPVFLCAECIETHRREIAEESSAMTMDDGTTALPQWASYQQTPRRGQRQPPSN